MRILIVTETFHPSIDGVVTRLGYLLGYLRASGHDVEVVAPGPGSTRYPVPTGGEPVRVHRMPSVRAPFYAGRPLSLPGPRVRARVARIVREFRPDVIHAVQPILVASAGVWAARRSRIPLVASYHTHLPAYLSRYPAWAFSEPLIRWATARQHARAEVTVVTSEAMRATLAADGIERPERMVVVGRGVDTALFDPARASAAMRARLLGEGRADWIAETGGATGEGGADGALVRGSHARGPLLLYVGRLAAEKDLESLAGLVRRRPEVRLALVGDGPHRRHLESVFAGRGAVFLGALRGEELAAAYASADAFIFPSVTETLGLVLLEAMASGLPVIAARSGPTEEQVVHGRTGLLYEPGGVEAAVDAVCEEALRARLARAARAEAERHSWDAASADVLRVYERARAAYPSARPSRQ